MTDQQPSDSGAPSGPCRALCSGNLVDLASPAFRLRLDTSAGLRTLAWQNLLTGRTIALGRGPELEVEIDRAHRRIGITGWRMRTVEPGLPAPDEEPGYRAGFFDVGFDDTAWQGALSPAQFSAPDDGIPPRRYTWARTHLFLPEECAAEELTLVLGGYGLFDFRYTRVFVNGHELGVRRAFQRWNEPGAFDLGPDTAAHQYLRWGQDNIIALQLAENITRTERLDQLDPLRGRQFYRIVWPAQFEQYIVVGTPLQPLTWETEGIQIAREGIAGEVVFQLRAASPRLTARVAYRWDSSSPVLHKFVEVDNLGAESSCLLNVRLGSYATDARVSDGEQGFPVYIEDECWIGLAHPSGWAIGRQGQVQLRQYPGAHLPSGATFRTMEAVMGVAPAGQARPAFLAYLRSRMRRVVKGHEQALAIFEGLGSWDYDPAAAPGPYAEMVSQEASDAVLLPNLRELVNGEAAAGYHFDIYSLEMWVDYHGDLIRFDPLRFPRGLDNINAELAKVGTAPGLWIDSSMAAWSIGGNPVVGPAFTHDPTYGTDRPTLCRASDPAKTMYVTAFRHHFRENGVRLVKTDNLTALCYNPHHAHLPGIYSTEAIQSAVVDTLQSWDATCPEVFLMLYWGYRSPWWLLHGDTLFEPGLFIEAAHPGSTPALHVRDSVTQGLDQAQWWCVDVPPLGKDSLGVWLSDWKWNSSIGTERWQEAFVMDLCRGSLLAQPWSDGPWLSPPERKQMADFIALLRARPACFANPRFILGSPWKNEPYGYCCTDGTRAFLALNNCTWSDVSLDLELNPVWGLAGQAAWDIYRWYPDPAQLADEREHTGGRVALGLRPFTIVLLEVVPAGEEAALDRRFEPRPLPHNFDEPSRTLGLQVEPASGAEALRVPREDDNAAPDELRPPKRTLLAAGQVPACDAGGTLAVSAELRRGATAVVTDDVGKYFAARCIVGDVDKPCDPVVRNRTYPAPWQAWRIPVEPSAHARDFEMLITAMAPEDVDLVCRAYFIPT